MAGGLSTDKGLIKPLFQRRVRKMRAAMLRLLKAAQPHLADRVARGVG